MARSYDKHFKEEALKLSDEIGAKKAADQLGIPYNTVTTWRGKRKKYGDQAFVGSGHKQLPASEQERLEKEVKELQRANDILQEALGFFVARRNRLKRMSDTTSSTLCR